MVVPAKTYKETSMSLHSAKELSYCCCKFIVIDTERTEQGGKICLLWGKNIKARQFVFSLRVLTSRKLFWSSSHNSYDKQLLANKFLFMLRRCCEVT